MNLFNILTCLISLLIHYPFKNLDITIIPGSIVFPGWVVLMLVCGVKKIVVPLLSVAQDFRSRHLQALMISHHTPSPLSVFAFASSLHSSEGVDIGTPEGRIVGWQTSSFVVVLTGSGRKFQFTFFFLLFSSFYFLILNIY